MKSKNKNSSDDVLMMKMFQKDSQDSGHFVQKCLRQHTVSPENTDHINTTVINIFTHHYTRNNEWVSVQHFVTSAVVKMAL
jgi:hypothetical protein